MHRRIVDINCFIAFLVMMIDYKIAADDSGDEFGCKVTTNLPIASF